MAVHVVDWVRVDSVRAIGAAIGRERLSIFGPPSSRYAQSRVAGLRGPEEIAKGTSVCMDGWGTGSVVTSVLGLVAKPITGRCQSLTATIAAGRVKLVASALGRKGAGLAAGMLTVGVATFRTPSC